MGMCLFVKSAIFAALILECYGNSKNNPIIKNVKRGGVHFEGPHWSSSESALYWVDIKQQQVHRLDGQTGNITTKEVAYGPVSLVVSVKNNPKLVLLTSRTELYFMKWDSSDAAADQSLRLLSAVDLGLPNNRCNDGKVDAKGRLWFGTMGKEENEVVDADQGSLFMLNEHNYHEPPVKIRPVSISNGIAWTRDNRYMYYIDTPTRSIDVMDFDVDTGAIRNRRSIFSFQAYNVSGFPDGMTIDLDDNLWIACFNGGKVIKIDSRAGKLMEQHSLPVSKITSVMWGGPDLATLYVTTSKFGLSASEIAKQPDAGSLFAIEGTGAKGRPEHQFLFSDANKY